MIFPLSYKLVHWLQLLRELEEIIGRVNKKVHTGSSHEDHLGWKNYSFRHYTKKYWQVFLLISQFSFCCYYFLDVLWQAEI